MRINIFLTTLKLTLTIYHTFYAYAEFRNFKLLFQLINTTIHKNEDIRQKDLGQMRNKFCAVDYSVVLIFTWYKSITDV